MRLSRKFQSGTKRKPNQDGVKSSVKNGLAGSSQTERFQHQTKIVESYLLATKRNPNILGLEALRRIYGAIANDAHIDNFMLCLECEENYPALDEMEYEVMIFEARAVYHKLLIEQVALRAALGESAQVLYAGSGYIQKYNNPFKNDDWTEFGSKHTIECIRNSNFLTILDLDLHNGNVIEHSERILDELVKRILYRKPTYITFYVQKDLPIRIQHVIQRVTSVE